MDPISTIITYQSPRGGEWVGEEKRNRRGKRCGAGSLRLDILNRICTLLERFGD